MLSKYFKAIGAKRLSVVEVSAKISNQHELNGIGDFKRIFGPEKCSFETTFIALYDEEERVKTATGQMTWYDARENHPTRSEYRLYYSDNDTINTASAGDLLIVAKINEHKLAAIVAPHNSTCERQLLWLFGLADLDTRLVIKDFTTDRGDIGFAGRHILSSLGFETDETLPDYLELILENFGMSFPPTKIFSDFSRSTVKDVSPIDEPDKTLMIWMEQEELLFKTLEKAIVNEKLKVGFEDVEDFIRFSLSVQNRRKARAGFSFENNLSLIFRNNNLAFTHGGTTERNNKPDFIFPGIDKYHSPATNITLLSMLGVKTTAKDRWRQILSEAEKIKEKHLITLEPAISKNQTEDMIANKVQLVIPKPLMNTFKPEQTKQIIDLQTFISIIREKEIIFNRS